MATGVFRYREQYYRRPPPRIHTARQKPRFYLPDAAIRDQWGRRKWFVFDDHDLVGFILQAQFDNEIAFKDQISADNGTAENAGRGATCIIAAVSDVRWKIVAYTQDFTVT